MTEIPKNVHPRPDMFGTIRQLVVNTTQLYHHREEIHAQAAARGFTVETPELDDELIRASIRLAWHLRQFVGITPGRN